MFIFCETRLLKCTKDSKYRKKSQDGYIAQRRIALKYREVPNTEGRYIAIASSNVDCIDRWQRRMQAWKKREKLNGRRRRETEGGGRGRGIRTECWTNARKARLQGLCCPRLGYGPLLDCVLLQQRHSYNLCFLPPESSRFLNTF